MFFLLKRPATIPRVRNVVLITFMTFKNCSGRDNKKDIVQRQTYIVSRQLAKMTSCTTLMFSAIVAISFTPGVSKYSLKVNGISYNNNTHVYVEEGEVISVTCNFTGDGRTPDYTMVFCISDNNYSDKYAPWATMNFTVERSFDSKQCYCRGFFVTDGFRLKRTIVTLNVKRLPKCPTLFKVVESGMFYASMEWLAGHNGGSSQTFTVRNLNNGEIQRIQSPQERTNFEVRFTGLKEDTEYTFVLEAENVLGKAQDCNTVVNVTTASEKADPLQCKDDNGAVVIAQAVAFSVLSTIVVALTIVVVLQRRKITTQKKQGGKEIPAINIEAQAQGTYLNMADLRAGASDSSVYSEIPN